MLQLGRFCLGVYPIPQASRRRPRRLERVRAAFAILFIFKQNVLSDVVFVFLFPGDAGLTKYNEFSKAGKARPLIFLGAALFFMLYSFLISYGIFYLSRRRFIFA